MCERLTQNNAKMIPYQEPNQVRLKTLFEEDRDFGTENYIFCEEINS